MWIEMLEFYCDLKSERVIEKKFNTGRFLQEPFSFWFTFKQITFQI